MGMYGLLGISMGAVMGAGYSYYKKAQVQPSTVLNENMGITSPVMETAPSFQTSREVFLY
jgi:predicted acylesterase/phospholipase RssA